MVEVLDDLEDFAPCRLVHHDDGRMSLCYDDFDGRDVFVEAGREDDGYGWTAVVDYLVRTRALEYAGALVFDPQARMFVVSSHDRGALRVAARLMREALIDPDLLREALRNADGAYV